MLQAVELTIRLHPEDDVVIARTELANGTRVTRENVSTVVTIPAGHKLAVRDILIDCDADTVLLKVQQIGGAACHEGYKSCFFRQLSGAELKVIAERVVDPTTIYSKK